MLKSWIILAVIFIFQNGQAAGQVSTGAVFGVVFDSVSGEPLYGAAVSVVDTQKGGMTDAQGRFRIEDIPSGTCKLRISMIGYKTLIRPNVRISPGRSTEISVSLEDDPVEMDAVVVKAKESYFEKDPEAEVSGRTIDTQEILDGAGGMMDVQRIVQVLPSVVSGSDQMNEIIVRGGNYGENLFVMDGIEIPNPNHFASQGAGGGPISLLRAEFIRDVSFLAGAFPAKFGDKASSVMDINLRRGSRDRNLSNVDIGMAGAGFMAEGPFGSRGSYLLSARKSFLDLIISNTGLTAVPQYYNFQGKVTVNLGEKHTLLWNSVYGADSIRIKPGDEEDLDEEHVDQSTDLMITGLTLKSALVNNVYSELVLSHVRNNWETDVWEDGVSRSEAFYNNYSTESETNLKYNLSWFLGKHELSGGVSFKNSAFDHNVFADQDTVFIHDTSFASAEQDTVTGIYRIYQAWRDRQDVSTLKSAAYGQLRLNLFPRLMLRLGGRYDHIEYTGDSNVSPRLGFRYTILDNLWLNGAYGVHYQSPSYLALTAHKDNDDLKNYHTRQYVLGTEWQPKPEMRITFEGYTKRYRDIPVQASWLTPDPWDSSEGRAVNGAKGHSEGLELYVHRKMSSSYMYIFSYSFYRAWFEDPRTGEEVPWDFDHRNVLTFTSAKRWTLAGKPWYDNLKTKLWYKMFAWLLPFGDEVLLSAKWRYAGGRPYTKQEYLRPYHTWIVPGEQSLNTERMADYHRLDIRLDQRYYFKNWSLVFYLDVVNIYNRDNIWDYTRNEYGEKKIISQYQTMPIGGFNIEF